MRGLLRSWLCPSLALESTTPQAHCSVSFRGQVGLMPQVSGFLPGTLYSLAVPGFTAAWLWGQWGMLGSLGRGLYGVLADLSLVRLSPVLALGTVRTGDEPLRRGPPRWGLLGEGWSGRHPFRIPRSPAPTTLCPGCAKGSATSPPVLIS